MRKGTIAILSTLTGVVIGAVGSGYIGKNSAKQKMEKIDKFKSYYNMLNQWLVLKQDGKSLEKYFVEHGYKTIAIYGMGEMGNRLYDELKNSSIKVAYGIDNNSDGTYTELSVHDVEDELQEVDAIIVSAIFAFDEIEEVLSGRINCPIISLGDVVYEE